MFYYVKTDRLFKDLEVEIPPVSPLNKGGTKGGFKFFFDVSQLQHKKAFEKKQVIYDFKEKAKNGRLVFDVSYTERGKKTKITEILKALKHVLSKSEGKEGVIITEDVLERAFRIFEKQSEVDYFINKNAKEFLKEQFNIWLYQYVFSGESEWTETRIKQLQILKDIAFKIINFISQFEDELVKIWNKPKFVLNSNYVITLDRILKNSPSLKGWQAKPDGVVYWKDLPYNPKLREKAKELRKAGNLAEVLFWKSVKNKQFLGLDFDRQKIIGSYIVDFYCKDLGFVVEIDGESHDFKGNYDEERDKYLKTFGLEVFHFKDKDIKENLDGIIKYLKQGIKNTPSFRDTPLKEGNLIEKIINHNGIDNQIKEWKELGIVDDKFKKSEIIKKDLTKEHLNPKYKHLPIDTKYFKDLELEILELFDNHDESLDGWLIKSENYQALNTILPKFKERMQTIYIDPPFNKEQDADYFYSVKYKDSSWVTLLENRLQLAKDILNPKGSIFVRCDYNGNMFVRILMNKVFGEDNFRNEIIVNKSVRMKTEGRTFPSWHDSILLYCRNADNVYFRHITEDREVEEWRSIDMEGEKWDTIPHDMLKLFSPENVKYDEDGNAISRARIILGKKVLPRRGRRYPPQEIINELEKQGKIKFSKTGNPQMLKPQEIFLTDDWTGFYGYSFNWDFPTENSEILLKRIIESTSNEGELVMDFFLGSGTTTAVAHKLKRKWLGVEMGEHFYTVVLPRMKKVLFYDKSGISKEKDVKERYNENNTGGFFKYYELEQYEDTLRKVKYDDSDLFDNPYEDPYNQYVFMKDLKMLKALEIDSKNNKVKVDLSKLYGNIDIPETLSNLLGKRIKKIAKDEVEFEDGEKVNIKDLDYNIIKPLIWW